MPHARVCCIAACADFSTEIITLNGRFEEVQTVRCICVQYL